MTDQELIDKANELSRWDYADIDDMIPLAQTAETRNHLRRLRYELYDMCLETI